MFTMANEFRNLNITDNFVYSYHDKMLKTTVMDSEKIYERAFVSHSIKFRPETFKRGPRKYVMSIMEPLDGYSPLHEIFDRRQRRMRMLRLEPGDIRVILFQVIHHPVHDHDQHGSHGFTFR